MAASVITDVAREGARLLTLQSLELLDSAPDPEFDDFAVAAAALCGTPTAMISLVDRDRQWFKARVGCDFSETARELSFCAHAIEQPDQILETPDARLDPRFADNPQVTGSPHIRFYAGVPLVIDDHPIGTLCVIDSQPRELNDAQRTALRALARGVVTAVLLHRVARKLGPAALNSSGEVTFSRADADAQRVLDDCADAIEVAHATSVDPITGLSNRALVEQRLQSDHPSRAPAGALLLLELERLPSINDAFGRAVGDRLLRAAAERIQGRAPAALAARLEGSSFALVLPPELDAADLAAELHHAFRTPFEIDGHRITTPVGIGIARADTGESAERTMREAETALHGAKELGPGETVFAGDENSLRQRRQTELAYELELGIERDQFSLEYQPIVDTRWNIVKIEALMRWDHPELGRISPAEFIPIAERNEAIVELGRMALNTACRDLAELREVHPRLTVSVNVSARQLTSSLLATTIGAALERSGIEPGGLELEITESTIMAEPARAGGMLSEIHGSGVRLALDDFGTGYSCLSLLQRIPVDTIKIDRTFVSGIPSNPESSAIVTAIALLAKRLSLDVVAEGVERLDQAAFLRSSGCGFLQGFYFSHPMALNSLRAVLGARRRARHYKAASSA